MGVRPVAEEVAVAAGVVEAAEELAVVLAAIGTVP